MGFRRQLPAPRQGFDERFTEAATFESRDGLQVDLHRTLAEGPFGLSIDADSLHEQTEVLHLADRSLLRLDDATLAIHVFVHASLGSVPPPLLALRDVLQIAKSGTAEWGVVAARARQWNLSAVVSHSWAEATRTLTAVSPPPILQDLRPRRRERRTLALYTTHRRARGGVAVGTIGAIPGFEGKARYVRALLIPSREFLAARAGGTGWSSYVRRWSVPLRWVFWRGHVAREGGPEALHRDGSAETRVAESR